MEILSLEFAKEHQRVKNMGVSVINSSLSEIFNYDGQTQVPRDMILLHEYIFKGLLRKA